MYRTYKYLSGEQLFHRKPYGYHSNVQTSRWNIRR